MNQATTLGTSASRAVDKRVAYAYAGHPSHTCCGERAWAVDIGCLGGAQGRLANIIRGRWRRMAIYVMLTTLTDEGRKTIKENPERIKAVNQEVEAMGAKIIGQYALLGPYDFVNILDAPSNEVITRVAINLGARGTLGTLTMAGMTLDDFIKGVKK